MTPRVRRPHCLIPVLALALGAFGCSYEGGSKSQSTGQDEDTSTDPDADACRQCWSAYEECMAGVECGDEEGMAQCDEMMVQCDDICSEPPPPPDEPCQECFAFYDECVAQLSNDCECSPDTSFCDEVLEQCLSWCEPEPPPPPVDDCEHCYFEFDECMGAPGPDGDPDNGGEPGNPEECEQMLQGCLATCQPEPPPPDECDFCYIQFDECVGQPDNPEGETDPAQWEECQQMLDECLQGCQPEPPPVDECDFCYVQFDECMGLPGPDGDPENGGEPGNPEECEQMLDQCLQDCQPEPPPVDECDYCHIQFEECIGQPDNPEGDPSDPAVWEECQQMLDQCLQECQPEPPPPVDECDYCYAQFDECVGEPDNGEDPAIWEECQQMLDQCLNECFAP